MPPAGELPKRVALFGGAFNPPHLAHLFMVRYLLTRSDVDEVWVMPSERHAFGKEMAPFEVRLSLLSCCFRDEVGVRLCEIEREPSLSGRSFDTLSALSERYPELHFKLVIGADNLTSSHRWHRFDELVARWSVIALGRPGHERALHEAMRQPWCSAGPTLPDISSSGLREALSSLSTEAQSALLQGARPEQLTPPLPYSTQAQLSWLPDPLLKLALKVYAPSQANASQPSDLERGAQGELEPLGEGEPLGEPLGEGEPRGELEPLGEPLGEPLTLCLWGRGRAGQALALGLSQAKISVVSVSLREASPWLAEPSSVPLTPTLYAALKARVWVLLARDGELKDLVRALVQALNVTAPNITAPLVALHCAGALGVAPLTPLKALGVSVGQWHPLQALRGAESAPDLEGSAFLIQGEPLARASAARLTSAIGGWSLYAPPRLTHGAPQELERARALYHCAAVLASNLPLVLFGAAVELFVTLGWSREEAQRALGSLARVSLSRAWEHRGDASGEPLQATLTGPLSRGDLEVLHRHIEALLQQEEPSYTTLAAAYLKLSEWGAGWLALKEPKASALAHLNELFEAQKP